MNPKAQRIAIAEACGWTEISDWGAGGINGKHPTGPWVEVIPDYLNDLNAMHDAEKFIPHSKKESYWDYLYENCQRSVFSSIDDNYKMITATAAQRAEAYLRTIGKWERIDER